MCPIRLDSTSSSVTFAWNIYIFLCSSEDGVQTAVGWRAKRWKNGDYFLEKFGWEELEIQKGLLDFTIGESR